MQHFFKPFAYLETDVEFGCLLRHCSLINVFLTGGNTKNNNIKILLLYSCCWCVESAVTNESILFNLQLTRYSSFIHFCQVRALIGNKVTAEVRKFRKITYKYDIIQPYVSVNFALVIKYETP